MNLPPHAARAAEVLRKATVPAPVPGEHERARGIATIARAQQARRSRHLLTVSGGAVLATAALVLIWVQLPFEEPHAAKASETQTHMRAVAFGTGASVVHTGGSYQLTGASHVGEGSRLITKEGGGARLSLASGSTLGLDGSASVTIKSANSTRRFLLHAGSLQASVTKLRSGERFIVDTPDASVEVRGTEFKLSVVADNDCEHESRTRLVVTEGLVAVTTRSGALAEVAAGQRWPAVCWSPPSTEPVGQATQEAELAPLPDAPQRASSRQPVKRVDNASSSIGKQNDLFAKAVRARASGNTSQAIALYQKFETTYPNSPLAQNANVERMRLLARTNPALARQEARSYLKKYPGGFAQHEARQLSRDRRQ